MRSLGARGSLKELDGIVDGIVDVHAAHLVEAVY